MKKLFRQLFIIIWSGILSCLLLSLFAIVYDLSGAKITNPSLATFSKWDGHQLVTNMKEGFAWIVTDEDGFNNKSKLEKVDVLIMGDSHMEGIQVSQDDNLTGKLNNVYLKEYNTYNIGISGTYFPYCVNNLVNALNYYKPSKAVIFDVTNDSILPDSDLMNVIINGNLEKRSVQYEHGIMAYIKRIPCVKPLLYGIQNWKNQGNNQKEVSTENSKIIDSDYYDMLNDFMGIIHKETSTRGIIPIVVYLPSEQINSDGTHSVIKNYEHVEKFNQICNKNDIVFVDMSAEFKRLYNEDQILAHGFINTAVGEGHINKYGHRITANRIAQIIMDSTNK